MQFQAPLPFSGRGARALCGLLLGLALLGGTAAICDRPLYCYTQPFGALSRQWSHGARRRYDFQTACQINRHVLAASLDRLTPRQAVARRTAAGR